MTDVEKAVISSDIIVVLKTNGDVISWGRAGFIGDGSTEDNFTPTTIASNARDIEAGQKTCAYISNDDELYLWGSNTENMIGDGSDEGVLYPKEIMENVKSVSMGSVITLCSTNDGKYYGWGWAMASQLGESNRGAVKEPLELEISNMIS